MSRIIELREIAESFVVSTIKGSKIIDSFEHGCLAHSNVKLENGLTINIRSVYMSLRYTVSITVQHNSYRVANSTHQSVTRRLTRRSSELGYTKKHADRLNEIIATTLREDAHALKMDEHRALEIDKNGKLKERLASEGYECSCNTIFHKDGHSSRTDITGDRMVFSTGFKDTALIAKLLATVAEHEG